MFRTDGANNVSNLFTNGPPATQVNADWLNAIQEEIAHAIEGASITLNKANTSQLLSAINALIVAYVQPHIAVSNDSGAFTTSSTSEVAITNMSVSISGRGRPMLVSLTAGTVSDARIHMNGGGANAGVVMLYRGATLLSSWDFVAGESSPASFQVVDATPVTGTNTYTARAFVFNGSDTLTVTGYKLTVVEF